jgi:hypothetical protein
MAHLTVNHLVISISVRELAIRLSEITARLYVWYGRMTEAFRLEASLPLVLSVLVKGGCASTDFNNMTRPDATERQAKSDREECWESASATYPKNVQDIMAGTIHTNCKGSNVNLQCVSTVADPVYRDVNGYFRYGAAVSCMERKGYR